MRIVLDFDHNAIVASNDCGLLLRATVRVGQNALPFRRISF